MAGEQAGGRDGQTESVDGGQALSDCERGFESEGADGTDRQTAPSLRGIDSSAAGEVLRRRQSGVSLDGRPGSGGEKAALEHRVEEL